MRKILYTIGAGLLLTTFAGCSGPEAEDYAGRGPEFNIREYLNGDLEAWGTFISRSGEADPQFYVAMNGSWNGNTGKLVEDFTYSDGKKQHREWTLVMQDDHHFTGTAADVVGTGIGKQYGNAVNMKYVLHIADKDIDVDVDDWLYRIDEKTVINRSAMTKYGFQAGELVISFRKK